MSPGIVKLIVSLALLFPCLTLSAQKGSVTGRTTDSRNGDLVPFAQVAVYTYPDSVLVGGGISDDKGEFRVSGLNKRKYTVTCSILS